jgi:hypothetical protein
MKHILVVGVRSALTHKLMRKYKGMCRFTFLTDQDAVGKKRTGTYSAIIACTKFTRHATEDLYSSHECYIRISGGITNLEATITALLGEA